MDTLIRPDNRTFWGRTGHYGIASVATGLVGDATLRDFLETNLDRISYPLADIVKSGFDDRVGDTAEAGKFVPLADVPDEIWKHLPKREGSNSGRVGGRDTSGSDTRSDGPEHPNHYADVDVSPSGDINWRDQCLKDADLISAKLWLDQFYRKLPHKVAKSRQGLLPFRVWQLFDAMVDYVRAKDLVGFLAAAGVCAHYVGDACQPLHGSVLSNGDPDPARQISRYHPKLKKCKPHNFGEGVHQAYETNMISANVETVIAGIAANAPADGHGLDLCRNGKDSARAVLQLMADVAEILPPLEIVNIYQTARSAWEKDRDDNDDENLTPSTLSVLWDKVGERTINVMVEGARTLAGIWESAWVTGGGPDLLAGAVSGVAIDTNALRALYIDPEFVPSKYLGEIQPLLR